MTKPDRAHSLLAAQRAGLEKAIELLSADRLGRLMLGTPERLLRMVATYETELAAAPEFHAPLILGFMGDNGWAPLVRQVCRDAERIEV